MKINRRIFGLAVLAGWAALGGPGCRFADSILPSDLVRVPPRVEKTFDQPLERVFPAALAAVDERGIDPVSLTVRDSERGNVVDAALGPDERGTKGSFDPYKALVKDEMLRGEIQGPDGRVRRAQHVGVIYRGTVDGQPVEVVLQNKDEGTLATARVGRRLDKPAAQAIIDRIGVRLAESAKPGTPPKP